MRRRRRPLLRGAAMVGGGAALYKAGKSSGANAAQAQEDAPMEQAPAPAAQPAAAGGISDESIARLKELAQLHEQGVLTDAEFEAQKKEILG
jgi:hypothetical protein